MFFNCSPRVRDCIRFPLKTAPHSKSLRSIQYTPHVRSSLLGLYCSNFSKELPSPFFLFFFKPKTLYDKWSHCSLFFVFLSGCLMFPWQCTSSSDAPVWQEHQDAACKKRKEVKLGHLTPLPITSCQQETSASLCMV